MCVCVHMCSHKGSFILPCRPWGLNSDYLSWQQVPLPTKPTKQFFTQPQKYSHNIKEVCKSNIYWQSIINKFILQLFVTRVNLPFTKDRQTCMLMRWMDLPVCLTQCNAGITYSEIYRLRNDHRNKFKTLHFLRLSHCSHESRMLCIQQNTAASSTRSSLAWAKGLLKEFIGTVAAWLVQHKVHALCVQTKAAVNSRDVTWGRLPETPQSNFLANFQIFVLIFDVCTFGRLWWLPMFTRPQI